MSRHQVVIHPMAVFVGWDQPLQTFFFQVYDPSKSEDQNPVVWRGTKPRELYEIEDLVRASRSWVTLDRAMRAKLYGDRDEGR